MASVATITVADVLREFGEIPLCRIRTTPPPGAGTVQDVVDLEARENRLFELIDGVLLEKTRGYYESYLAGLLCHFLTEFVREHKLGIVAISDGMVQLYPDQVRIPDVSFVSFARLPGNTVPREPVPNLVPDLAVEESSHHAPS